MKAYKIQISELVFYVIAENKQTAINEAVQRVIDERAADEEYQTFNCREEQQKWDTVYEQLRTVDCVCFSDNRLVYPGQEYLP